jgi:hypothetical protein
MCSRLGIAAGVTELITRVNSAGGFTCEVSERQGVDHGYVPM